jgi:hypothetical protein
VCVRASGENAFLVHEGRAADGGGWWVWPWGRTLGPPEDDISTENVVFRRKCRLPPKKNISADFFLLFFFALH